MMITIKVEYLAGYVLYLHVHVLYRKMNSTEIITEENKSAQKHGSNAITLSCKCNFHGFHRLLLSSIPYYTNLTLEGNPLFLLADSVCRACRHRGNKSSLGQSYSSTCISWLLLQTLWCPPQRGLTSSSRAGSPQVAGCPSWDGPEWSWTSCWWLQLGASSPQENGTGLHRWACLLPAITNSKSERRDTLFSATNSIHCHTH